MPNADRTSSPVMALGWAAYLACSWTWCIGMFLPILLVRDYGTWGFLVFAVPNILGAAGMGWVLRRPNSSERTLVRNLPACHAFSLVTIAFQCFFAGWMLSRFGLAGGVLGTTVAVAAFTAVIGGRPGIVAAASALALIVSYGLAAMLARQGVLDLHPTLGRPSPDLVWLAPVCAFGFGLCPYLDMTFHRARRMAPGASGIAAFTIGFGVFFAALIAFTFAYRGLLVSAEPLRSWGDLATSPAAILCAYLFLQLGFTVGVHSTEDSALRTALAARRGRAAATIGRSHAIFIAAPLLLGLVGSRLPAFRGLEFNEVAYRSFMAFYGLVFPAYVWLCMIPTRDGHSGLNAEKARVLAAAIGVAGPMFWMGFIERQEWWLAPGLAVVLGSRLLLPRSNPRPISAQPAPSSA